MKSLSILALSMLLAIALSLLSSCFKTEFAVPPDNSGYDPHLTVTHTLAQLQNMPQGIAIASDVVISGTIVMNDKSGNYFNKIVIQDETGGMEICISQSHLDKNYPVGRKVYVKCKGLFLGNDNQNLQLGMMTDVHGAVTDIPEKLIPDFIVKANFPNPILADTVTLATLSSLYTGKQYLNKLVVVKQAEFARDYIGVPYAQSSDIASSTILTIQDCSGARLSLRTSGYAAFQPLLTPSGNGYVTGIYTRNNFTPQLSIRDTADVHFCSVRCDGTLPDASGITSLAAIRNLCPSSSDSISELPAYKISGVVISDKDGGNIAATNIVIQQGDKGIVIRFAEAHTFAVGDSVIIDIHHTKLSRLNNLLQVSNIQLANVSKIGAGKTVAPRVAAIAEIITHYSDWESTLVTVVQATIPNGATYSGSRTLSDNTGNIVLYTRSAASFAGVWTPHDSRNFTGILSTFNDTKQLQLRNLADVR